MKKSIYIVALFLVPLIAFEWWLQHNLFEKVSYSNSESVDKQIAERNADNEWGLIFIGDSEVRWGVNPNIVDTTLQDRGYQLKTFNHAFDGFGGTFWTALLPSLLESEELKQVKVVALGVQLIGQYRFLNKYGEQCGALQRPIFNSPMAVDLGIDNVCEENTWDLVFRKYFKTPFYLIRYPSAVRAILLPDFMSQSEQLKFNSAKSGEPSKGFVPHFSIADNEASYASEFKRWKAQYIPEKHFIPMEKQVWYGLTSAGGFFAQFKKMVEAHGKKLVLFALPTNPVLIDTFNRRQDYTTNSKLLAQWADENKVTFVDTGLKDYYDAKIDFSDMRHLSAEGANKFSLELAEALVKNKQFLEVLN